MIDFGVVNGVALGQFCQEGREALGFVKRIQFCADRRVGGNVIQSVVDGLDIQSAASGHDGDGTKALFTPIFEMAREPVDGLGFELSAAVRLRHRKEVDKMMGRCPPFFCSGLRCTDGDFPIELSAVGGQDVCTKGLRDADGETGLADGGWPDHSDEERSVRAPGWGRKDAQ